MDLDRLFRWRPTKRQVRLFRWRPTKRQVLWTVGIVVALVAAIIIVLGYVREWGWTGLVKDKAYTKRTLWDWLQLLIIPAVLAGVGLWFNRQQRQQELQTADRRAQDEALQGYLDQMSAMLLPDKDQPSLYKARLGDSLSSVARARTLTVLPRLAGEGKGRVVQFLYEAGLIAKDRPIVDLAGADLSKAYLSWANLEGVNLSRASLNGADLTWANLNGAYLSGASLLKADLSLASLNGANLSFAVLSWAVLRFAVLEGVNLSRASLNGADLSQARLNGADLSGASLNGADLSGAELSGADLFEADLFEADLSFADLSGARLSEWGGVKFLTGATMPDGQQYEDWLKQYEDWLKSRGRGEAGENSGP